MIVENDMNEVRLIRNQHIGIGEGVFKHIVGKGQTDLQRGIRELKGDIKEGGKELKHDVAHARGEGRLIFLAIGTAIFGVCYREVLSSILLY